MCREAVARYKLFGTESTTSLECDRFLGEVQSKMDKLRRAAETNVVGAVAKSFQQGSATQMKSAVTSLWEMKRRLIAMDLTPLLRPILTILHQQDSTTKERGGLGLEILFQIARIASDYSERQKINRGDFDYATPLFSAIFSQIGRLNNSTHGTEKARAYLEYALHCLRREKWDDSFSYLATKSASCANGVHVHVVNKLEQYLNNSKRGFWYEGTHITGLFEAHIDGLRWLLERSLEGEDSPLGTKSRVGLVKGWHQSPHSITYYPRMDSTSFGDSAIFRYGVTYSKPSIAGISESEFMVP